MNGAEYTAGLLAEALRAATIIVRMAAEVGARDLARRVVHFIVATPR